MELLLRVPALTSGKGYDISSCAYNILQEWLLLDKIQAFVFDTTASNTVTFNGTCHVLEKKLGRDILYLPCRRHVYEIVLTGVFTEVQLTTNSGPDILLFKIFHNEWKNIEYKKFSARITDESVRDILKDVADEIVIFAKKKKMNTDFSRDDNKEFFELIIIYLGGTYSPRKINILKHLVNFI